MLFKIAYSTCLVRTLYLQVYVNKTTKKIFVLSYHESFCFNFQQSQYGRYQYNKPFHNLSSREPFNFGDLNTLKGFKLQNFL